MTLVGSEQPCPRCDRRNRSRARYCAKCGAALQVGATSRGMAETPPLAPPAGFEPCLDGPDLFVSWRHGESEPVLGAEAITVDVFNAGPGLRDVRLRIVGTKNNAEILCHVERFITSLIRGETARIEIPSYELPGEVAELLVSLASSERLDVGSIPRG